MSQTFMNQIKAGAIQSWHKHQILPSLVGAQAALESGYGTSGLSLPPNNNLFGIKSSPDWVGPTVWMWTNEHANGSTIRVNAEFRVYDSWSHSVEEHGAFFTNTAWRKQNYRFVVGEKDYKKATTAVRQAGYATDPDYTAKLIRIIEQYNLQAWDQEAFQGAGGSVGTKQPTQEKTVGGSLLTAGRNKVKELTITVVGDSLGVGTEPYLRQMNWLSDNYNNYGSRQWTHGTAIYDALVQLQTIINNNQLNEYVIMILGTNRGVNDSEIKRAVDMIGSSKKLLLVDTASEVGHRDKVSIAYKKASETYSNVFYVDWSNIARQNISNWYHADGANGTRIHMNSTGYKKHAEYITQAVYEVANTNWSTPTSSVTTEETVSRINDIKYIDYQDKKFISPPGESAVYNQELNEQFGFKTANGEVMWIEHVIEVNTTDEAEMLQEALRYMEEHSSPSAQYTVKLTSLPDTISIGDTGIFVDHQFNPPLYIQARILEIVTSESDPSKDSVTVGNVKEIKLQDVSNLLALQKELQQTREELLYEYYENEPVTIEVETTNGLILSEKGHHREKVLAELNSVSITSGETQTFNVDNPRDKYRTFRFTGQLKNNISITENEIDLSLSDEPDIPVEPYENPQGEPVPDLMNVDRVTKDLIHTHIKADFLDDSNEIIFTTDIPLLIDSTFEYSITGQDRTINQIRLHGKAENIELENIKYVEKSQTMIESTDNTQAIVRLRQRGLDVTNRFNNYQWTRVSSSPLRDNEWNDNHKFWTENHLTLNISDIHDNESTFICRVFNEDWTEVVNSIGVVATRAQSGLSAYQVWLNAGHTGTEEDFIEFMRGNDGDQGLPGQNNYIHTAWATDPLGTNFSTTTFGGATWMGTAITDGPDDPTDYSAYDWIYVKGEPGLTDEEREELMDSVEDTHIIKDLIGLDGGQTFNKNRLDGPVNRVIAKGSSTSINHNGEGYNVGDKITISADVSCLIKENTTSDVTFNFDVVPFVPPVKPTSNVTFNFTTDNGQTDEWYATPSVNVSSINRAPSTWRTMSLVDDFGAVGDGVTDDSQALKDALQHSNTEPIRLDVGGSEYEYYIPSNGNVRIENYPGVSKGIVIFGNGAVFAPKNERTIDKHEFYLMQIRAEKNSFIETSGFTLDGKHNPQDMFWWISQGKATRAADLPLQKGISYEGSDNIYIHDMTYRNMYGGYLIKLKNYTNVDVQNIRGYSVGGNDNPDSFGTIVHIDGQPDDSYINIDDMIIHGKKSPINPAWVSWIGIVIENGTTQSDDPNVRLADRNTNIHVTNSEFYDFESLYHIETQAGNIYWNTDNVKARVMNYTIGAGVRGEIKDRSNHMQLDILPFMRKGLSSGLYHTYRERPSNNLTDENGAFNHFHMYNSIINYLPKEDYAGGVDVHAISHADSVVGNLHNVTLNNVPRWLVANASANLYDTQVNLKQGYNSSYSIFSNQEQYLALHGTSGYNQAGSWKEANEGSYPPLAINTGFVAPPLTDKIGDILPPA